MITEGQRQKVLKALRDSYAKLTAEQTTEKEFENIIEAMEIVKKLTITDVSKSVCPKCGNTGRCEPRTLSDPDGQECDCGANCC